MDEPQSRGPPAGEEDRHQQHEPHSPTRTSTLDRAYRRASFFEPVPVSRAFVSFFPHRSSLSVGLVEWLTQDELLDVLQGMNLLCPTEERPFGVELPIPFTPHEATEVLTDLARVKRVARFMGGLRCTDPHRVRTVVLLVEHTCPVLLRVLPEKTENLTRVMALLADDEETVLVCNAVVLDGRTPDPNETASMRTDVVDQVLAGRSD